VFLPMFDWIVLQLSGSNPETRVPRELR